MVALFFILGCVAAVLLPVVLIYLFVMAKNAKYEATNNTPRTEFFTCDKHGAFPTKFLIDMPVEGGDPVKHCPFCYEDAFKTADDRMIMVTAREELAAEKMRTMSAEYALQMLKGQEAGGDQANSKV